MRLPGIKGIVTIGVMLTLTASAAACGLSGSGATPTVADSVELTRSDLKLACLKSESEYGSSGERMFRPIVYLEDSLDYRYPLNGNAKDYFRGRERVKNVETVIRGPSQAEQFAIQDMIRQGLLRC